MKDIKKYVARKRQALRLHIESMNSTHDFLKLRVRNARHDPDAYETAIKASRRLQNKIEQAKLELNNLENHWHD